MRVKNICLFLFFFYLAEAEADPKFVNVDGLAAAAGQSLLDKELTFLQGSFGILIVISCKYVIWPFLKMFGDRLLRNCEYYFFYFFYIFIYYFFIFIISGKWWNDLVNYFNPPPAAAAAAPPPNLEPLEELLRQQLTMLGQIKLWPNVLPPSNILIN
jgi:hypothetical protein